MVTQASGTAEGGWAAAVMFAVGVALPYLSRHVGEDRGTYLGRLLPHFWIGCLLPIVSFLHSCLAMSQGSVRGLNMAGIWLATGAMFSMLWQIALGLALQSASQPGRRTLRRTHFWTMALMAGLIVAHIALNRP
jgi:cytochrome b561